MKTGIVALSLAGLLAAAASSASATTFLTDSLGTLTINPVTQTGELSDATTLIYKKTTHPTSSALSYSFVPGTSATVSHITPASYDATQIDYTFHIATPVALLYGQVINTVQGNRVALGHGTIQLWDLTTDTSLTPVFHLTLSGNTNSATTANDSIDLFDTDDLYALRVIGNVPVRPTSSSLISVQYSPSVFATAVPEPAAWAMLILGVTGVGAALRRRLANPALMAAWPK
jgi:hypothetical protein